MYATIHIRSNIFFAIEKLSQYFNDFAMHHEQVLKTLLRYIRFTLKFDIIFDSDSSESLSLSLQLKVFSNFDYAADRLNRKSILDYVYMLERESIA